MTNSFGSHEESGGVRDRWRRGGEGRACCPAKFTLPTASSKLMLSWCSRDERPLSVHDSMVTAKQTFVFL